MTINLDTGKPIVLSRQQERMNLHQYGTKPFGQLTPQAILQTAEKDLLYAELNRERRRKNLDYETTGHPELKERMLPYAFPKKMVGKAKTAAALLEKVIDERETTLAAKTAEEHMLFGNDAPIHEALKLAQKK